MIFSKNLFIALIITIFTSPQLVTMGLIARSAEDDVQCILPQLLSEGTGVPDFQIYQFLSTAIKTNPQLYLPDEVTHIIVTNVCKITELECFKRSGMCVASPNTVLDFIQNNFDYIGDMAIVNILKTCLRYCDKSLSDIRSFEGKTALHCMGERVEKDLHLDCVKILLRVAGDHAWDFIKMEDHIGCTVFYLTSCSSAMVLNELLSAAPCPEELWKLVSLYTEKNNTTVLHVGAIKEFAAEGIKTLLSCAPSPECAWLLINEQNGQGRTPLDLAILHGNQEVIEIFESYRPLNL